MRSPSSFGFRKRTLSAANLYETLAQDDRPAAQIQKFATARELDEGWLLALYGSMRAGGIRIYQGINMSLGFNSERTWVLLVLTVLSTAACSRAVFNLSWSTSMTVVAVGTVFPVVFSIQAAYNNRERSLKALGGIKAGLMYIYFNFKNWDERYGGSRTQTAELCISQLIIHVIDFLRTRTQSLYEFESERDFHARSCKSHLVYDEFQKLVTLGAGDEDVPPPTANGMMLSIRDVMKEFEAVKAIRDTETPKGLRYLCYFLITSTPWVLAPYWSSYCEHDGDDLEFGNWGTHRCAAGYFVGIVYVLITSTLLRVQEALEDPFDGHGDDDINWSVYANNLDQMSFYGPNGPELREADATARSYQKTNLSNENMATRVV